MIPGARYLATLLALALPLLGASAGFAQPPIVVVYPLTTTVGIDAAVGANVAIVLAEKLAELGALTVKPAVARTERAHYLDAALADGADYYITGFLTPLGADTSLIAQVVSTHSGSVVYSTTANVRTVGDAASQADALHAAIVRHAGRGLAALDAPAPTPSSSVPPVATGGNVNITQALRRRGKGSKAPSSTTASPSAAGTARTIPATAATARATGKPVTRVVARARPEAVALLFRASGTFDDRTRAYATDAVDRALTSGGYRISRIDAEPSDRLAHARDLCATTGATSLLAPAVVLGANDTADPTAQIDLAVYDCDGAALRTERAIASSTGRKRTSENALDRAAVAVASALARPHRR